MVEFNENEWQIKVPGNNRLQNYIIPIILIIAGLEAYTYTGFCSVLNLLSNSDQAKPLITGFGAQSFSLLSYGSAALVLGGFLYFSAICDIGAGLIKFDKTNQQITLIFKGYPGGNERLFFSYSFRELQSIKILYTETPIKKQSIFLVLESNREIPVLSTQNPSQFILSESFITNLGLEMGFTTEIIDRSR